MYPQIYFSHADRQMESYFDKNGFKRALVLGILFNGDLVVPDIFLFISQRLAELLADDENAKKFIIEGIKKNALKLSLREKVTPGK